MTDGTIKLLSFGHISLPDNKIGSYLKFIDSSLEVLCQDVNYRNIIYVGNDIKDIFNSSEIEEGDSLIEKGRRDVANFNRITTSELEFFNDNIKQKILK